MDLVSFLQQSIIGRLQNEADAGQLLSGVGHSHILAGPLANVAGDLVASDVLDKDLRGVVGWGWGVKGNHISGCSGTCITGTLSSHTHLHKTWHPPLPFSQPLSRWGYGGMNEGWCRADPAWHGWLATDPWITGGLAICRVRVGG